MTGVGMAPAPVEIRLTADRRTLDVDFAAAGRFSFSAEYLRVNSPSAEVQGHGASERKTVPGKRDVRILRVEPVGRYAVRLVYDDGHMTGIYSWDVLLTLGHEQIARWRDYLASLDAAGSSRDS